MIGIYKIENSINGKVYIGSSICIEKRFKTHITSLRGGYHKNKHLQKSFLKNGLDIFLFTVIEECDISELLEKETQYILSLNSYKRNYGYNIYKDAAHSRLGIKHTDETKKKISLIQKGKVLSEEHRLKVVKNLINGSFFSDELRLKLSIEKRKFDKNGIEKLIELYNKGFSQKEISNITNSSKTTINAIFKKLFKDGIIKKGILSVENDVIKELKSGLMLQKEIAKKYNISQSSVTKIKKTNGI